MTARKRPNYLDPPAAAIESERQLIGAVLVDPERMFDVQHLDPRAFGDEAHRVLFEHLLAMHQDSQPPDATILVDRLKRATGNGVSAFELAGGAQYLGQLIRDTGRAQHATYHAKAIQEAGKKRRLHQRLLHCAELTHNGVAAVDILDRIDDLKAEIEAGDDDVAELFPAYNAAELVAAEFDLEYIVEGVLCADHPCLIGGGSKSLKTTIALDLAIAVAAGGHFLGYFPAKQRAVGIFSAESGLGTLKETSQRIAAAAGVDLAGLAESWFISGKAPQFRNPRHLAGLGRWIAERHVQLVIIDPAYLCLGDADPRVMMEVGPVLAGVNEVCSDNGATLIIAHHTRQTIRDYEAPHLGDFAFAGFEQWARQWILLKRRQPYQPGRHDMWLSTGGSMGHAVTKVLDIEEGTRDDPAGRRWVVEVLNLSECLEADKEQREREREQAREGTRQMHRAKLRQALLQCRQGETSKTLRELAGLSGANFGEAIRSCLADGLAERCTVTKAGRNFDGYRPTERMTE